MEVFLGTVGSAFPKRELTEHSLGLHHYIRGGCHFTVFSFARVQRNPGKSYLLVYLNKNDY